MNLRSICCHYTLSLCESRLNILHSSWFFFTKNCVIVFYFTQRMKSSKLLLWNMEKTSGLELHPCCIVSQQNSAKQDGKFKCEDTRSITYHSSEYQKNSSNCCRLFIGIILRLVFTSDGVRVGGVIRSIELYDLEQTAFWFFWFRLLLRCLQSSENWVIRVTSWSGRTKPITKHGSVHCDWFILPLLLLILTICFSLRVRSIGKSGFRF